MTTKDLIQLATDLAELTKQRISEAVAPLQERLTTVEQRLAILEAQRDKTMR